MKHLLLIITVFIILGKSYSQDKIKIVTSASIFADMTKRIAGDLADVKALVPIGSDPHKYEPTPSDIGLIQHANLILINGLTFEGWMNEVIDNSGTKAEVVRITEGIIPITSVEHTGATDPHAWMTASNGLIYIKNIYLALKKVLPVSTHSILKQNYDIYAAELEQMDAYMFEQIKAIPTDQRILVTSHDAFNYYGSRYGLELLAVLGISTESDAQTSDVRRIIDKIKDKNLPAIFIESTINPKIIQQIASDSKVKIGGELFADSIGDSLSLAPTYIAMLEYNTNTIAKALKGESVEASKSTLFGQNNGFMFLAIIGFMALSILVMIKKIDVA